MTPRQQSCEEGLAHPESLIGIPAPFAEPSTIFTTFWGLGLGFRVIAALFLFFFFFFIFLLRLLLNCLKHLRHNRRSFIPNAALFSRKKDAKFAETPHPKPQIVNPKPTYVCKYIYIYVHTKYVI